MPNQNGSTQKITENEVQGLISQLIDDTRELAQLLDNDKMEVFQEKMTLRGHLVEKLLNLPMDQYSQEEKASFSRQFDEYTRIEQAIGVRLKEKSAALSQEAKQLFRSKEIVKHYKLDMTEETHTRSDQA